MWSVISTMQSGMGNIASGLTYDDALESVRRYEARGDGGIVITTDNAASKLMNHRCDQPPRVSSFPIVMDAESNHQSATGT